MGADALRSNVRVLKQSQQPQKLLSIVVPVLNEQDAAPFFLREAEKLRGELKAEFGLECEVVFVDDGSTDATTDVIRREMGSRGRENWIRLVVLSRNFGKEIALTAGLRAANGDLVVPMDVDLQDPPETVIEMVREWRRTGVSVVQAIRSDRTEDSFAKRFTAERFYKLMGKISSRCV